MKTIASLKRCLVVVGAASLLLGVNACSSSSNDPGVNGQPTPGPIGAGKTVPGSRPVGTVPGAGPAGSQ